MGTEENGGRTAPGAQSAGMPGSATPLAELERLQQALTEAEERARAHREQYLRAVAELDNVRKRAQRDIEAANRYGLEKFAAELLPVRDSLELAVQSADRADVDARSLKQGQEATLQLLAKALERLGIAPISPVGETFDPTRHEAMLAQESAGAKPDTVLQVVQTGYELNGRVIRPARVIVAKAPAEG
ncbi:MAG: nucleotide exchange factor GrpE [Gammaproteobacteria bacterium]|nr:nucleotide exchange factor GrpE [Gammaproteobacteria bacterium]MDE2264116.1 nucleotide exchange factor GrpE [Gammaproteobacteria bacterium]